jgi:F-box domain
VPANQPSHDEPRVITASNTDLSNRHLHVHALADKPSSRLDHQLPKMPHGARNIMSLLMPMFSGNKDEYGKDAVPPLPLSFDRVMEGRPAATSAPLFGLPDEILSIIIQHVDHQSLKSLALVNSDCRQIARSVQFNSIRLDYGQQSWNLLYILAKEAIERLSDTESGMTLRPAIGACIRRITVATNPGYLALYHKVELTEEFTALDKAIQDERIRDATKGYFDLYLGALESAFSHPKTLPYLELFDWEDRCSPSPVFFNYLTHSNIQHLKLYRLPLEEE